MYISDDQARWGLIANAPDGIDTAYLTDRRLIEAYRNAFNKHICKYGAEVAEEHAIKTVVQLAKEHAVDRMRDQRRYRG